MNESNGKRKPIQSNDVIRVVITPPLDSFRIRLRTWFLFLQSANSMTRWQHNSSNLRRRRRFELTELIASKRDDLNEMQSAFGNHSRNQHERITTPVKSLQSTINTDQEMGSDKEREREREREREGGREGGKKNKNNRHENKQKSRTKWGPFPCRVSQSRFTAVIIYMRPWGEKGKQNKNKKARNKKQ